MLAHIAGAIEQTKNPSKSRAPADDILDLGIGVAMVSLLGLHWEFLPSFVAKLVPGVDLVPLWSLSVANVYRKSKRSISAKDTPAEPPDSDSTQGSV